MDSMSIPFFFSQISVFREAHGRKPWNSLLQGLVVIARSNVATKQSQSVSLVNRAKTMLAQSR